MNPGLNGKHMIKVMKWDNPIERKIKKLQNLILN